MSRTSWSDTAGLPLRTRILCYALARAERTPFAEQTLEQIARSRGLSPAPVFPASLVIGGRTRGVQIDEVKVTVRDGHQVPTRRYRTGRPTDRVLLYLHGGGWVLGRPQDYDSLLTLFSARADCTVLAPDYRMAPEYPAPTPVHDVLDVFDHFSSGPAEGGTSQPQIVVGGDSAGGNLSALTAIHARDRNMRLVGQVLVYPATDLSIEHELRNAPMLNGPKLDRYKELYLSGSGLAAEDPILSPARADVRGVAPALVQTADRDPLGPEGNAYARQLQDAGVAARLTRYYGVPHGFLNLPGATHVGRQARQEIVDQLNDWWSA
ncbi:alpha/beta hydrolase [Calidifontibacter terrae]